MTIHIQWLKNDLSSIFTADITMHTLTPALWPPIGWFWSLNQKWHQLSSSSFFLLNHTSLDVEVWASVQECSYSFICTYFELSLAIQDKGFLFWVYLYVASFNCALKSLKLFIHSIVLQFCVGTLFNNLRDMFYQLSCLIYFNLFFLSWLSLLDLDETPILSHNPCVYSRLKSWEQFKHYLHSDFL